MPMQERKSQTTTSHSRRCAECGEKIGPTQDFCSDYCARWHAHDRKKNAHNSLNESICRTRQTA